MGLYLQNTMWTAGRGTNAKKQLHARWTHAALGHEVLPWQGLGSHQTGRQTIRLAPKTSTMQV
jgi:hypothetical protein